MKSRTVLTVAFSAAFAAILFIGCSSGTANDPLKDEELLTNLMSSGQDINSKQNDSMQTWAAKYNISAEIPGESSSSDSIISSSSSEDAISSEIAASSIMSTSSVVASSSSSVVASSSSKALSSSVVPSSSSKASSSSLTPSSSSVTPSSSAASSSSGNNLTIPASGDFPAGTYTISYASGCTQQMQPQCGSAACTITYNSTQWFTGSAYANSTIAPIPSGSTIVVTGGLAALNCW